MTYREFAYDKQAQEFIRDHQSAAFDYMAMRLRGESHNMAAICSRQLSPALVTDSTFLSDNVNGKQFAGSIDVGNHHKAVAAAAGVSTAGSVYMGGLARYPGDPEAWVSGRGDVARIAERRGWGVEGSVNVARREVDPGPDVVVGHDIVESATQMIKAEYPNMSNEDARGMAIDLRSGKVDVARQRVETPSGEALDYCPDF